MEFRSASLADYAALFPHRNTRQWRFAAVQIMAGPSWTLFQADRPVLLCGVWPFAAGVLEAWVMMPSGSARPGTVALKHLLRRLRTVCPDHILIARVDDANTAGQRLVIMSDFVPLDEHWPGTKLRTWLRPSLVKNGTSYAQA